ncbi:MAG: hypothetical protein K2N30_01225 [Clostridia bacterium]|nr:hypothetical protein [Clostridia bacterium]
MFHNKHEFTKEEKEVAKSWVRLKQEDVLEDICRAAAEELHCVACSDYYNAMFFFANGQAFRLLIDEVNKKAG